MSEARTLLEKLAKKLRSRITWLHDGYYTDESESITNASVRTAIEAVIEDIEELLKETADE